MVQFFDKNGDPQLDPYEILSLPQTSTDAQIKKAYRMQMLQLHPDKLSPTLTTVQIEQITEQFHNVKDAYEFLISPVYLTSRRMYMTKLSARRAEYERKEAYIRRHGSCNTAPVGGTNNNNGRNDKYDSRSSSGGYTVPNNYSRGGTHSNVNTSGTAHAERMKSMHRSQSAPAMNHRSDRRHSSNTQSRDRRRNVNNSTKYYTNRGRQHATNTKNTHTMGRDIRYKRDNVRVKPRSYNVNSKYHEQHRSNQQQQHRSRSRKRESRDKQYNNRGKSEEPRRSRTSSDRRKESSRGRNEHRSRSRHNQRDRSDVRQQYYQENEEKKKRRRAKSAPARYARNMKNRFSSKPTTNNNKSSSNNKRSSSKDKLPSKYYCPLTKKVYKDPVIDNEGNTYERLAILKWLRKESCSPITNEYLCEEMLKSDLELKREIYKLIGKPRSKSQSRQKSRPRGNSNNSDEDLVSGRVLIDSYLHKISSNSKLSINLDGMGICAFSYRRITFVIEVPITPHAGFMVYSSFNYDQGDVHNTISNKIEAWNDWLQNIKRSSRVSYTQQSSSNKLVFTLRGSEFDMNKCTTFQKTLEYFIEMSLKLYNILIEQQNGSGGGEMKQVDNVCLTRTPVVV